MADGDMTPVKEIDPMQIKVEVSGTLDVGKGGMHGEYFSDEDAQREAVVLRGYFRRVDADAGSGCIEDRPVVGRLEDVVRRKTLGMDPSTPDTERKLGPKTAGGNAVSTLFALELVNWFDDDKSALNHFGRVVSHLELHYQHAKKQNPEQTAAQPVKPHVDTDTFEAVDRVLTEFAAELDKDQSFEEFVGVVERYDFDKLLDGKTATRCGMADHFAAAYDNMSLLPGDIEVKDEQTGEVIIRKETQEEIEERLDFIRELILELYKDTDPGVVNATFDKHVANATEKHQAGYFNNFKSIHLPLILAKVMRDQIRAQDEDSGSRTSIENILDQVRGRIEVVKAEEKGLHGHFPWATAVVSSKLDGWVLDTTAYAEDHEQRVLAMELWQFEEIADEFASGEDVEGQKEAIKRAAAAANFSGYVGLGDGSQRTVQFTL